MPRKITKLREEDIEIIPDEPEQEPASEPEGESEQQAIVPYEQAAPVVAPYPDENEIIMYVAGNPITRRDCYEFGENFMGLYKQLFGLFGLDNSPKPEGKRPNYLKVHCANCDRVTVTVAPHTEKHCSGCGSPLPLPEITTPIQPWGGDGEVVEADYTNEEEAQ